MENYYYDSKNNTFYIRTEIIIPKQKPIDFKKVFSMSYEERLKKFCSEKLRTEIKTELNKYLGCKISEFTSI